MLRSLGHEIIKDGPGNDTRTIVYPNGPRPWLVHNMRKNYIPAWYAGFEQGKYKGRLPDVAVITDPESRWNNYYLEGLNWMIKNMGIDGVYIDDSSFDGETMRRARRIFDADGKRRLVDQHTWNHMNPYGGYANSINLSLDRLPYVDRLWIGELFRDYNKRDFWLVEMSGIPFGVDERDARRAQRFPRHGVRAVAAACPGAAMRFRRGARSTLSGLRPGRSTARIFMGRPQSGPQRQRTDPW